MDWPACKLLVQFSASQIEGARLQRAITAGSLARRVAARGIIVGNVGQPLVLGTHCRVVDDDQVVFAEMVEEGRHPLFE